MTNPSDFSETTSACDFFLTEVEVTEELTQVVETSWHLTPLFFQSVCEPATKPNKISDLDLFTLDELENDDVILAFNEEGEVELPEEVCPF